MAGSFTDNYQWNYPDNMESWHQNRFIKSINYDPEPILHYRINFSFSGDLRF
jgi:hypothetical protein